MNTYMQTSLTLAFALFLLTAANGCSGADTPQTTAPKKVTEASPQAPQAPADGKEALDVDDPYPAAKHAQAKRAIFQVFAQFWLETNGDFFSQMIEKNPTYEYT